MKIDSLIASYVAGYTPGIVGRLTEMHGVYYARAWGVGAEFETLMAREVCDFIESYDPDKDLLLSAVLGERVVGTIAMLRPEHDGGAARLRWFLLDPACQGRGIGAELLHRSLRFARERYTRCYLWTVTGLPASMHLYRKAGFTVAEEEVDARYGAALTNVKMELDLSKASLG